MDTYTTKNGKISCTGYVPVCSNCGRMTVFCRCVFMVPCHLSVKTWKRLEKIYEGDDKGLRELVASHLSAGLNAKLLETINKTEVWGKDTKEKNEDEH